MIAIDTNILVHAHRRDAQLHENAKQSVAQLAEATVPWCICYHSLIEFFGVVTQSKIWNMPSTAQQAFDQIRAWHESPSMRIIYDHEAEFEIIEKLAVAGCVQGGMIHDARIAACCIGNGVHELWTVDRDFSRFPSLKVKNPLVQ